MYMCWVGLVLYEGVMGGYEGVMGIYMYYIYCVM